MFIVQVSLWYWNSKTGCEENNLRGPQHHSLNADHTELQNLLAKFGFSRWLEEEAPSFWSRAPYLQRIISTFVLFLKNTNENSPKSLLDVQKTEMQQQLIGNSLFYFGCLQPLQASGGPLGIHTQMSIDVALFIKLATLNGTNLFNNSCSHMPLQLPSLRGWAGCCRQPLIS